MFMEEHITVFTKLEQFNSLDILPFFFFFKQNTNLKQIIQFMKITPAIALLKKH